MFVFRGRVFALVSLSLLLAGCGEGWEKVTYSNQTPYTMEGTAGSGVMYVRAKLMPEKKELKLANDLEKQLSGSKFKGFGTPKTRPPEKEASAVQPQAGESSVVLAPASAPVEKVVAAPPVYTSEAEKAEADAQGLADIASEAGGEDPDMGASGQRIMMQRLSPEEASTSHGIQGNRITASALPVPQAASSDGEGVALLEPPAEGSVEEMESVEQGGASGFMFERQVVVPKVVEKKPLSDGERELNNIYGNGEFELER